MKVTRQLHVLPFEFSDNFDNFCFMFPSAYISKATYGCPRMNLIQIE